MACHLASSVQPTLLPPSVTNSRISCDHRETLKIFASARRNRLSVARAMKPPSNTGSRSRKLVTRASNGSGGPGIPIPDIPIWVRVVLGSIVCLALPFYKKILRIEGEVEKDAKAVVEAVETVAELSEKIAEDVAAAFPGNEGINKLATEMEKIAEEVEKDAEKAEAFLDKVDEIEEEIERLFDPTTEKDELTEKENIEKKETIRVTNSVETT